jgi:hypothetical protein
MVTSRTDNLSAMTVMAESLPLITKLIREHAAAIATAEVPSIGVAAQALVDRLQTDYAADWQSWVEAHVAELVADRLRTELGEARRRSSRRIVEDAHSVFADRQVTVAPSSISRPLDALWHVGDSYKPARLMTRGDWLAVADHRSKMARSLRWEAAYATAVARRLPDDTTLTGDVIDDTALLELHASVEPAA